jgi:hypothetical protein
MGQRSRLARYIGCCLAAIFLSAAAADTAMAQRGARPAGPTDLKSRQREREQREAMLRTGELGVALTKMDKQRLEAAIKQVQEDFKQIQIVRNELVRALLAGKPLDYKTVSDKTGDINKRADRLKTYLMHPVPEEKENEPKSQIEFNNDEMKEALVRLCNQIAFFIDNPVLKNPGTVDVEQSAKAGGELLSIIELSGNIKKSADKLNKSPK